MRWGGDRANGMELVLSEMEVAVMRQPLWSMGGIVDRGAAECVLMISCRCDVAVGECRAAEWHVIRGGRSVGGAGTRRKYERVVCRHRRRG